VISQTFFANDEDKLATCHHCQFFVFLRGEEEEGKKKKKKKGGKERKKN
jgi:hypothetical protein